VHQFAKLLHWIEYFTQILGSICRYLYNHYTNLIILHGFRPICTNLTSYCTKSSILQLVGLIHAHMISYCSKLSILQVVWLIRTHLTSCCVMGTIYSLWKTNKPPDERHPSALAPPCTWYHLALLAPCESHLISSSIGSLESSLLVPASPGGHSV
jgi:hypothetical protein